MQPNNKDAREKYETTSKEHRLRQLQMCLGYDDSKVDIKIEDIIVEPSYDGPKLEKSTDEINPEWVKSLMQYQKDRKVLHKKYACMIIKKAKEVLEHNKSLVDIHREDEEEITVCGDIHG
jgi:serine/threonine-protein phosphatase 5